MVCLLHMLGWCYKNMGLQIFCIIRFVFAYRNIMCWMQCIVYQGPNNPVLGRTKPPRTGPGTSLQTRNYNEVAECSLTKAETLFHYHNPLQCTITQGAPILWCCKSHSYRRPFTKLGTKNIVKWLLLFLIKRTIERMNIDHSIHVMQWRNRK